MRVIIDHGINSLKEQMRIMVAFKSTFLLPAVIGVVAIVLAVSMIAVAQGPDQPKVVPYPHDANSIEKLAEKLTHINPEIKVVNGTLTSVDGIALAEVRSTNVSTSMNDVNGNHVWIGKDNQARLSLKHGVSGDGQDIISVTITNNGTSKFYLIRLILIGGASIPNSGAIGFQPINSEIVSEGYSPQVWGSILKPAITEAVTL